MSDPTAPDGRGRRRIGRAPRLPLSYVAVLVVCACVGGAASMAVLTRLGLLPSVPLLPPTATPSVTVPPTLTPSATPSPSPSPTYTPIPPARVEAGDAALAAGDWPRALAEYAAVQANSDDPALLAAAALGQGLAHLNAGEPEAAIDVLTAFVTAEPDAPNVAEAQFILGDAYRAAGQWPEAIAAYDAYLELRPNALDAYAQASRAQAAIALGDYDTAIAALQAAIAAPQQGDSYDLQEQLAEVYGTLGDVEQAVATYDAVYQATDQNWRKARVAVKAGQLLYADGQTDAAYEKFLDVVNNYPEAAAAFEGLVVLVNDGVPVDDLQRGLTNYYADNYEPARDALLRYRAAYADGAESTSGPGDATALYHLGLTYAALEDPGAAIAAWRELVDTYPGDSLWAKAYLQIAFIQPYPDDVGTFTAFVEAAPEAPDAPDALFRAARLRERNDDFAGAVALWNRLAEEYPDSAQAPDAAMQAGLVLYRSQDYGAAGLRFEQAQALAVDPYDQARAALWIGKVKQALGDDDGARAAWTEAAGLGPHGYYALRAQQLLDGQAPFWSPARYSFSYDEAAEQAEAEAWLRATFPQAQSVTNLSEPQPGVWQELRFVRGAALWKVGRWQEAHAEFDSLRVDLSGDPLATWQLAVYFHAQGLYDLAIRAARQVVDLAGVADTLRVPAYILRLRYPAPFSDRVVSAANTYSVHPFVMYAKMRIESFFWKYSYSVADARGLNQFIPPTANDVAAQMGLTGFVLDDLYRPAVSIPMGAYYLNYIAEQTGAGPEAMLAGYYAGPGNAEIWLDLADGDVDLFVEVIRLPDAKGYVTTTFEYFEEYRELYGQ